MYNTHEAAIALLPLTTHPQSWAEPHIHIHTGKSLPSVPPSPEELTYFAPQLQPAADPQPKTDYGTSHHRTVLVYAKS